MYSREKRMKAIELYIKYGKSTADLIRELGYPDRKTLPKWYRIYLEEQKTGILNDRDQKVSKYSLEEKQAAVDYFLDHGQSISRTVRVMGYPSRETFRIWCKELAPGTYRKHKGSIKYTHEQRRDAVEALCSREGSVKEVVNTRGVTRATLYKWKNILLCKEVKLVMPDTESNLSSENKENLLSEISSMKKQIKKLKLELDVWEGTVEIIKKDPGADPKNLTNREKAILIDALRKEHPLKNLLDCVHMKRSSFFYHCCKGLRKDKYSTLKRQIINLFEANGRCYGYRRIHALLAREGKQVSEKVVRRLMAECALVVFGRRKRKYSSYRGENAPSAENIIKRNFHSDKPNTKWLTDITEVHIPAGKVYLSPIMDCFDGMLVSWTISTHPDTELVNTMLDIATTTLRADEHPVVHSDRGSHYRSLGWIERMEKAGLSRSMSKKGCSPDNASCEGLFGRLKNEMFYHMNWSGVSIDGFINILDKYLYWYNEKRIKMSLGAMSPLEYRQKLGLVA